ncbi:MAG: MBL fold metallo-hydrolase [Gemmatimonadota bacterium]
MPLVLEQVHTPGLAQLSYLVGDDAAGVGAVIDARRDIEVYVDLAAERGLRITHAIETHIHADFVSGAHELASRTGARIVGGASRDYRFDLHALSEGDEVELGAVTLRALHTPGHTPEHISLLLSTEQEGEHPFAVFTGDTLLNLAVGRPDLIGPEIEERLARSMYRSLREKLYPLGDGVQVLPGHTAGSACARSIGHRRSTTIGSERRSNPALQHEDEDEFVASVLTGLPEPPRHYARLKKVNAAGAPVRGRLPHVPPLSARELERRMSRRGALLLDIRPLLAFGGGHIPGALHIALDRYFPTWVGWMVDPDATLLLVADHLPDIRAATEHLFRLGFDRVEAFLHPGMKAWQDAALPLERTGEWSVHELNERRADPDVLVLDVRSDPEWNEGHVPGARHIYVPHLEERLDELDRAKTIAAYCGSGYRSSIAASVLQRHGYERVATVPGSMKAWKAAGLPLDRADQV